MAGKSENPWVGFLTVVVGTALLCVVAVPMLLWIAFVVTKLWAWHVVPTFGAAPLPLANAVGLVILLGLLRGSGVAWKGHEQDTVKTWTQMIVGPAFSLLFGWLATLLY